MVGYYFKDNSKLNEIMEKFEIADKKTENYLNSMEIESLNMDNALYVRIFIRGCRLFFDGKKLVIEGCKEKRILDIEKETVIIKSTRKGVEFSYGKKIKLEEYPWEFYIFDRGKVYYRV